MYDLLSSFAQTWGLLIFIGLFAGVLVYALWPRNQARFDRAALAPLDQSDAPKTAADSEEEAHG